MRSSAKCRLPEVSYVSTGDCFAALQLILSRFIGWRRFHRNRADACTPFGFGFRRIFPPKRFRVSSAHLPFSVTRDARPYRCGDRGGFPPMTVSLCCRMFLSLPVSRFEIVTQRGRCSIRRAFDRNQRRLCHRAFRSTIENSIGCRSSPIRYITVTSRFMHQPCYDGREQRA